MARLGDHDSINEKIKKSNRCSILVIEDQEDYADGICRTIKNILDEFLFLCVINRVANAEDASLRISDKQEKFDLIFLDINLGQNSKSGYSLLANISKNKACNGLVVFTAIQNDDEYTEATPYKLKSKLDGNFPNQPNLPRRHLLIDKRPKLGLEASLQSLYEHLKNGCSSESYRKLARLKHEESEVDEEEHLKKKIANEIKDLKATMNPIQPAILELAAPKSLFIPPFTLELTNVDELIQNSLAIPRITLWSNDGVRYFPIPDNRNGNRASFFYFNLGVCKKHHKGIGEKREILSSACVDASLKYNIGRGQKPYPERATKEIFYSKNAPEVALDSETIEAYLFKSETRKGYHLIDSVELINFEKLTELRFPQQGK